MLNGKSLTLGFIVGGIAGAAYTLLSAPSSGRQFREGARLKSENLKNTVLSLREDGMQLKDQIAQTSKEGADLIKELSEDVKTSIESWKKTVEPHQKNIQKYLEQIEESLKELEEKAKAEQGNDVEDGNPPNDEVNNH